MSGYTYNAHRQRTSKTVNGQTTYYLYNQSGQLLAELDHSGQTKVEYVWLGTQPLAVIHSGPASAVVYYIHTDHLNTPQVVSDNQGTVVWRADYDAFGKASVASGSILTFNLRFPGQYFDSETGLHYNYYRDYDPSTGRYIQSDPIGLQGGLNTYAYVEGNPLTFYDPMGLAGTAATAGVNAVAGATGAAAGSSIFGSAGNQLGGPGSFDYNGYHPMDPTLYPQSSSDIEWPDELPKPLDPWTDTNTEICEVPTSDLPFDTNREPPNNACGKIAKKITETCKRAGGSATYCAAQGMAFYFLCILGT